jgi:hypothetical protein
MSKLVFRRTWPCVAEHPLGKICEREQDHDGKHYYTVWELSYVDGAYEWWPSYPIEWENND